MPQAKNAEIETNLAAFLILLPDITPDHEGQYALMRHGQIVGFYPCALDAQIAGNVEFSDAIFSIQQVTSSADRLGIFSCTGT